jgi:hypothetical protein
MVYEYNVYRWLNDTDSETRITLTRNLPQWHFTHHKISLPGIEADPSER